MPNTIRADAQKLGPGVLVTLFDLDATALGGTVFRFTNDVGEHGYIPWQGNQYLPLPIIAEGFEVAGKTTPSKPRLRVANVLNVLASAMESFGDLRGATLKRWRTFSQYLDDGDSPNPANYFPVEIYRVDRLVSRSMILCEWELTTPLDAEGAKLPARQVLREICNHKYRYYEGGAFQYAGVTCPYVGTPKFTDADVATSDPTKDVCSLQITGCRLRFGQNGILPIQAFPGVGRTRV